MLGLRSAAQIVNSIYSVFGSDAITLAVFPSVDRTVYAFPEYLDSTESPLLNGQGVSCVKVTFSSEPFVAVFLLFRGVFTLLLFEFTPLIIWFLVFSVSALISILSFALLCLFFFTVSACLLCELLGNLFPSSSLCLPTTNYSESISAR